MHGIVRRMTRLLTLNINFDVAKHGSWDARRRCIADAAARLKPDVMALQAVRRRANGLDQARDLAHITGLAQVYFVPARRDDEVEDGSAILTRRPVAASDCVRLTYEQNAEDPSPRILLLTTLDLGGNRRLTLANGHFSWVAPLNARNVEETLKHLAAIDGDAVLVGDFNATPDAPGMRAIAAAGWRDAWVARHGESDGATFEAPTPSLRIDYVWLRGAVDATRIERVHAPADAPVRLSDHFGLFVEL